MSDFTIGGSTVVKLPGDFTFTGTDSYNKTNIWGILEGTNITFSTAGDVVTINASGTNASGSNLGLLAGDAITLSTSGDVVTITGTQAFREDEFAIFDDIDSTKRVTFKLSKITSGNTSILTVKNTDYTIADDAEVGTKADFTELQSYVGTNTTAISDLDTRVTNELGTKADEFGLSAGTGITIGTSGRDFTIEQTVGTHTVWLTGGNGHGTTNTKIRRLTTIVENIGDAITYSDDLGTGALFTIHHPGLYSMSYVDGRLAASGEGIGISLNSSQLTTNITSITNSDRLISATTFTADEPITLSRSIFLNIGDLIRPHTNGAANINADSRVSFSITKIGS